MVKCPGCGADIEKSDKTWKYGIFTVYAYKCKSCGTQFRDYIRNGESIFMLKLEKGKGYVKALS